MSTPAITIIGAGPAGLGAAWALREAGYEDFEVIECRSDAGGLASSRHVKGHWWDCGGHVLYLQGECGRVVEELFAPGELVEHPQRRAIDIMGTLVPYPVQDHIDALYQGNRESIAADAEHLPAVARRDNFLVYLLDTFGPHLCSLFFLPFNRKRWGIALERMSCDWLGTVLAAEHTRKVYPRQGGIGEIWRRLAARFEGKIRYNEMVLDVPKSQHVVSTMPLSTMYKRVFGWFLPGLSAASAWVQFATDFEMPDDLDRVYYADAITRRCRAALGSPLERTRATIEMARPLMPGADWYEACAYPVPSVCRDVVVNAALARLRDRGIWSVGRFGAWRYEEGHMHQCFAQGVAAAREIVGA